MQLIAHRMQESAAVPKTNIILVRNCVLNSYGLLDLFICVCIVMFNFFFLGVCSWISLENFIIFPVQLDIAQGYFYLRSFLV